MADAEGPGDKYTRAFTRGKFDEAKADSDASKHWLSSFSQEDLVRLPPSPSTPSRQHSPSPSPSTSASPSP